MLSRGIINRNDEYYIDHISSNYNNYNRPFYDKYRLKYKINIERIIR